MNKTQCTTLLELLQTVMGLRQQLREATAAVKAFFKRAKIRRTPENMEQICNIMRVLYGANAVIGVSSQGSVQFSAQGANDARHFYYREINPYLPALRSRTVQQKKQNPEKVALGLAKRMKAKYGASFCKMLGALLLS